MSVIAAKSSINSNDAVLQKFFSSSPEMIAKKGVPLEVCRYIVIQRTTITQSTTENKKDALESIENILTKTLQHAQGAMTNPKMIETVCPYVTRAFWQARSSEAYIEEALALASWRKIRKCPPLLQEIIKKIQALLIQRAVDKGGISGNCFIYYPIFNDFSMSLNPGRRLFPIQDGSGMYSIRLGDAWQAYRIKDNYCFLDSGKKRLLLFNNNAQAKTSAHSLVANKTILFEYEKIIDFGNNNNNNCSDNMYVKAVYYQGPPSFENQEENGFVVKFTYDVASDQCIFGKTVPTSDGWQEVIEYFRMQKEEMQLKEDGKVVIHFPHTRADYLRVCANLLSECIRNPDKNLVLIDYILQECEGMQLTDDEAIKIKNHTPEKADAEEIDSTEIRVNSSAPILQHLLTKVLSELKTEENKLDAPKPQELEVGEKPVLSLQESSSAQSIKSESSTITSLDEQNSLQINRAEKKKIKLKDYKKKQAETRFREKKKANQENKLAAFKNEPSTSSFTLGKTEKARVENVMKGYPEKAKSFSSLVGKIISQASSQASESFRGYHHNFKLTSENGSDGGITIWSFHSGRKKDTMGFASHQQETLSRLFDWIKKSKK